MEGGHSHRRIIHLLCHGLRDIFNTLSCSAQPARHIELLERSRRPVDLITTDRWGLPGERFWALNISIAAGWHVETCAARFTVWPVWREQGSCNNKANPGRRLRRRIAIAWRAVGRWPTWNSTSSTPPASTPQAKAFLVTSPAGRRCAAQNLPNGQALCRGLINAPRLAHGISSPGRD